MLSNPISIFAQNRTQLLDSLKRLDVSKYPDTTVVEIYTSLANFSKEPDIQEKYALLLQEKAKKTDLVSHMRVFLYLGNAHKQRGNFEKALENYLSSLEIAKKLTYVQQAMIDLTIADTYKGVKNYAKAIDYYHSAKSQYLKNGLPAFEDSLYLTSTYINLGDQFLIQKSYDSAMKYFRNAEFLSSRLPSRPDVLAITRGNIAIVHALLGDDIAAQTEISECINYLVSIKSWFTAAEFLSYMIDLYIEKNQFDLASQYTNQLNEISDKYGFKKGAEEANYRFYKIAELQGDFESALIYHKKYISYRDSLINVKAIQEMADLHEKFEVGQKQAEVDLLTAEKRIQRIIIWATTGGTLLVLLLLAIVYRNYKEKNRINKKLEELNKTKDKLFSIISHDLRSPVHAFSGVGRLIKFAVEGKSHEELLEISEHVEKSSNDLSDLLDGLLNWALQQQGNFSYQPEKVNCRLLIREIIGIFLYSSKSKNIKFKAEIDKTLHMWVDKNMTLTVFRNLVNNALKFTEEGGVIEITVEEGSNYMIFKVIDSGVGIPKDKLKSLFQMGGSQASFGTAGEKGLGLGLQLVNEFVALNRGTIEVESEVGVGTTFIISLPKFKE